MESEKKEMTYRAGYDVTEIVYLKESTYGSTPTSGSWVSVSKPRTFTPRVTMVNREAVGLGFQQTQQFLKTKEYVEAEFEGLIQKKSASGPAWNWKDFFLYIVAAAQAASPTSRIDPFSLGAKLDLATDEFWHLRGCKLRSFEIRGDAVDDLLTYRCGVVGNYGRHTTTDYVSGTASRAGNPTTDPVAFSECKLEVPDATDILPDISRFGFTFTREVELRGTDATTPAKYANAVEGEREMRLEITKDFEDATEVTDFQASTERTMDLRVPLASGGVSLACSKLRWLTLEPPHRELDLVELTLTAKCTGLTVSDIA